MHNIKSYPWRPTSKREVVGSSPTVDKTFSFCISRFLCLPHSSAKPVQIKLTVTYTWPYSVLAKEWYVFVGSPKLYYNRNFKYGFDISVALRNLLYL